MLHPSIQSDAVVVLAPGVTVEAGCLRDAAGREHPVDAAGLAVVRLCRVPVGVDGVTAVLASGSGMSAARLDYGVRRFVAQLQGRGLLSVHQSFLRELWRSLVLLPFDVVTFVVSRSLRAVRFSSRRLYAPSLAVILRGVVEAFGHLAAFAGVVVALIGVVVAVVFPASPAITLMRLAIVALIASTAVVAVMATALVHESVHYLVAHALGAPAMAIGVRRGAVSVVFRSPSAAVRRVVAASGPLAGAAFAGGILTLVLRLGAPAPPDNVQLSIAAVLLVLVVAQLLCLLPFSADGRALFRTTRDARAAHA